jgi:hypothetical protein
MSNACANRALWNFLSPVLALTFSEKTDQSDCAMKPQAHAVLLGNSW